MGLRPLRPAALRRLAPLLVLVAACGTETDEVPAGPESDGSREDLVSRAAHFSLDNEYVPPPGEALTSARPISRVSVTPEPQERE